MTNAKVRTRRELTQAELIKQSDDREDEKLRKKIRKPFLDDRPMTGENPPMCRAADFRNPRLRKCPFQFSDLSFVGCIASNDDLSRGKFDGGLDGWNWKVEFKGVEGGPFVMKMFWDTEPPEPPCYYAARRECQNAALFQQIQQALSPATAEQGPILIDPTPACAYDTRANLYAFCDEVRKSQVENRQEELTEIKSMPRLRQCYGWMKVSGEEIVARIPDQFMMYQLKLGKERREFRYDAMYTLVIYEFIEKGENDVQATQDTIDFLLAVGFTYSSYSRSPNWTNSILLDFSDLIHTDGAGYYYNTAHLWLPSS